MGNAIEGFTFVGPVTEDEANKCLEEHEYIGVIAVLSSLDDFERKE